MSSSLPYLPPLEHYRSDVTNIAKNAVEDVRAAQSPAAKAGLAVRAAASIIPAAARAANDTLALPAQAAAPFARALFTGSENPAPAGPTVGLPQIATPPATQAPVAAPGVAVTAPAPAASGDLTVGRTGNRVAIVGERPAPASDAAPATNNLPIMLRQDPVSVGLAQQARYADMQRAAVLHAADIAAASGSEGNASYRYAAALHALPALSGANNAASLQEQTTGTFGAAGVGERERASMRQAQEEQRATEERASSVRHNVMVQKIGEDINPDEKTRPYAPLIPRYGTVMPDVDKDGKPVMGPDGRQVYVTRDMQGNVVGKPPAPGSATAVPLVGTRTSQKDGTYAHGSKSVTIKGGVITEVK
jgi:hypothetical protein